MDAFVGLLTLVLIVACVIRIRQIGVSAGEGPAVTLGVGLGGASFGPAYRETPTEKGPVLYQARTAARGRDKDYRFLYKKVDGSWRAYILRTPSPGKRDTGASVVHRLRDARGYYVCWDRSVSTLKDMEAISHVWADSIQTYIQTGKRFG